MVWMHFAIQAALIEWIWCIGACDCWWPEFLQLENPVINLSWEAAIIKATTANEAELWVQPSRSISKRLVLLDHESLRAGETAVIEPFGIWWEWLLRCRRVRGEPLSKIIQAIHEHFVALHELEAVLDSRNEVGDVSVHLEAEEVRVAVVVHTCHIFKVRFRPRDRQLRLQESL